MTSIITYQGKEGAVLEKMSKKVAVDEILSLKMQKLQREMKEILEKEKYGVAIAAPQIGVALQVFLIPAKTFAHAKDEEINPNMHKDEYFFNPEIIKHSKKMHESDEGCLSVPGLYSHDVPRYEKITMRYIDQNAKKRTLNASGFLARVLQHEYDHLQGVLYIYRAKSTIKVDENLKPIK